MFIKYTKYQFRISVLVLQQIIFEVVMIAIVETAILDIKGTIYK